MLWGVALGFDGMARFAHEPWLGAFALVPLGVGVSVGTYVAAGELCGFLRLGPGSSSHRAAFWILIAEVTTLGLCTASLWLRTQGGHAGLAAELLVVGFVIAMVAGSSRDLLGVQNQRRPRIPQARRMASPRSLVRRLARVR